MARLGLRPEVLSKIKNSGILFGTISDTLEIAPVSLPRLIYANDRKLTQATVLRVLREHLKISTDSELLTEITVYG